MNLNQVTLPSTDIQRSIDFYQQLGLKLIVKSPPNYARFECPAGDSTFSVHLTENLTGGVGAYIYFETDDLDQHYKKLRKAGVAFEHPPQDQSWLWREARLNDPDGNLIILYSAGQNRKNPPWRIN